MFDINDFNYISEYTTHDIREAIKITKIQSVISCVQIGRYIGQEIPEHLRNDIYEICEGREGLDHIINDQEMKIIIKNADNLLCNLDLFDIFIPV